MNLNQSWKSIAGVLLLATCSYFLGCEPNEILDAIPRDFQPDTSSSSDSNSASSNQSNAQPNASANSSGQLISNRPAEYRSPGLPVRTPQTVLIASFNIQVFGRSKMTKPGMPEKIAQIIRMFDIVAIQEIRDQTQQTIPQLMQVINANGAQYDYLISQPLGRTSSKEQYAYIYNTQTIIGSQDATYIVDDREKDYLHREPFVARFVTRIPANYHPFTFTLVNIHTDPDEVSQEIPVMHTVLKSIREFEYRTAREDDVLLMGDLNVEPRQFGELGRLPGIQWAINEPTNTRRNKIYDNILFDGQLTNEFTGRSGVFDMGGFLGLTREEELEISDHLPVWSEFSVFEQPYGATSQFAAGNAGLSAR